MMSSVAKLRMRVIVLCQSELKDGDRALETIKRIDRERERHPDSFKSKIFHLFLSFSSKTL